MNDNQTEEQPIRELSLYEQAMINVVNQVFVTRKAQKNYWVQRTFQNRQFMQKCEKDLDKLLTEIATIGQQVLADKAKAKEDEVKD